MNLFTRNSPYYHLLKYLLFLLKHPVCVYVCLYVCVYIYIHTHTHTHTHAHCHRVGKNSVPKFREVIGWTKTKDLLPRNCMSEMRPFSTTDRHVWVWLRSEIKQNHWSILKNKSYIAYQFRADVQTHGHRPRYTADNDVAERDVSAQKCQVAAWWLLLPQQYGQ